MKRVVDLVVLGTQAGIDQRPSREGEPHLVLRSALVVERQQLTQHLLDSVLRIRGAVEGGDAALDPLDHQSHGEREQLGVGGEVVA
jgi:hypothetical protein